ncbi:hypothetical protein ADA01nite_32440 [Aneurinibacillus danicus]|jgi:hypothetical protein|uniref:Uncharacterized protein n=1 Tax=Aneurinibacillus danicus TaxID=267746 RepID=A0A511VA44_9BACL|nr:hypothetical protein ADA01nite_32440 [Aneurinibacillus danicus]
MTLLMYSLHLPYPVLYYIVLVKILICNEAIAYILNSAVLKMLNVVLPFACLLTRQDFVYMPL